METTKFEVDKQSIIRGIDKVRKNGSIADFYLQLAESQNESIDGKYHNKANNIKNCYHWWKNNIYKIQKIIDVQSVSLCHDKFCSNCQN